MLLKLYTRIIFGLLALTLISAEPNTDFLSSNLSHGSSCSNCSGSINLSLSAVHHASTVEIVITKTSSNAEVYRSFHPINQGTHVFSPISNSNIHCGSEYEVMVIGVPISSTTTIDHEATILIQAPPNTNPGAIQSNDRYYCSTPATILSQDLGQIGNCSRAYQWEKSTNGGSTWTTIQNSNTWDHTPGTLSGETKFRRGVRISGSEADFTFTNEVFRTPTTNVSGSGGISIGV